MPLSAGVWKANVNGTDAELRIEAPDQNDEFAIHVGNVDGVGYWNESSQQISFRLGGFLDFEGCLFRSPANPEAGRDVVATLVGSLRMMPRMGTLPPGSIAIPQPTARRHTFGWLAYFTEVQ